MAHFHANSLLGASGQQGYQIERSLRFNSADSAYLNRTFGTPTDNIKWTWSGWVKRSALGSYQNLFTGDDGSSNNFCYLRFSNVDKLECYQLAGGSYNLRLETNGVFRDSSAWYHVVLIYDSANATSTDRVQVYVNGTRQTVSYVVGPFSQNTACQANVSSRSHAIGRLLYVSLAYLSGLLTEINFIDGQALTPSSFGETDAITGVWKPKRYTGTYGTNGFYLNFSDNSGTTSTTLGKDSSDNGNNWTPNNFSVTAGAGNDSLIDTPTPYADGGNGRGNYCTLNPLDVFSVGTRALQNGNIDINTSTGAGGARSTIQIPYTGKWYFEFGYVSGTWLGNKGVGIGLSTANISGAVIPTNCVTYNVNGNKTSGSAYSAYGATYTTTDTIGIAVDQDAGTVTFYKNNTSQGAITHGLSTSDLWALFADPSATASTQWFNFGQRPFAYTPPSGFKALNTQNLPEPSIKKPSAYMDAKLYTGNSSTQTISGLGFSPDLVWIKNRTTASQHVLTDTVRGSDRQLFSSLTNSEQTSSTGITAFTSDGFSLGVNVSPTGSTNSSPDSYVAWCWDESATPGFDIVTFTGTGSALTTNHSLGVTPSMMIVKYRSGTAPNIAGWAVYHSSLTSAAYRLDLNATSAQISDINAWNSTAPTATQFTVGTNLSVNGTPLVAYLWSEVAGFSKFGSYTGNGSSDGPFVFCGFMPRFVMVKRTDSTSNWTMMDAARDPSNVVNLALFANGTFVDNTGPWVDFTANGFKVRNLGSDTNTNGGTYIFAAFAEAPQKYSLAR